MGAKVDQLTGDKSTADQSIVDSGALINIWEDDKPMGHGSGFGYGNSGSVKGKLDFYEIPTPTSKVSVSFTLTGWSRTICDFYLIRQKGPEKDWIGEDLTNEDTIVEVLVARFEDEDLAKDMGEILIKGFDRFTWTLEDKEKEKKNDGKRVGYPLK